MSTPAIVLRGVAVDYGDGIVLDHVDLDVPAGEWLSLVGPNGAGKSTMLGVLVGLVAHAGTVLVDGRDPGPWRPRTWARHVALVPQRPIIPGGQTVTDYVLLGRTAHIPPLGVEDAADLAIVRDALDRLDLLQFADRPVLHLSGGELQRVVLARALVQQAPVLLLDEPTSALDMGHAQHVLELVDDLRREQGLTVVAAMHDLTLAGQYAERIVALSDGRIVADGRPRQVLTAARIREHWHANVRVLDDGDGGILVVPTRPGAPASNPAPSPSRSTNG